VIFFTSTQMELIRKHAQSAYPNECCGLITGTLDHNTAKIHPVIPSPNIAVENKHKNFEIDPQIRFDVMRQTEGQTSGGLPIKIIGHFHSHPDGDAQPSQRDLEMAYETELIWIIVSVMQDGKTEITAHRVNDPDNPTGFLQIELKTQTNARDTEYGETH